MNENCLVNKYEQLLKNIMNNFTHAIVEDGEIIRKFRWSPREAKWYKDTHPSTEVIKLAKEFVKPFNFDDYEEAPY